MKNNNLRFVFLVVSFLIIVLISLASSSINKLVFLNRAADNQLSIKIKLQGEYNKITGETFKTKVALYSQSGLVKEYSDQILINDNQSIFKLTIDTTGLNPNQMYAIFIKPDKYLGILFCSPTSYSTNCKTPQIIITSGTNNLDLTQDLFFSGDISPQDGKIAADDISKIMNQVGQVSTSYLATDINSDGMVQTVDYSLALYSLSKNYVDDSIPSTWVLAHPTPTVVGSTPIPTVSGSPTTTPTYYPGQPTLTSVPTVTITPTPTRTPTPTNTPVPEPTSTPAPAPITSDTRPGTTLAEIFNYISKTKWCVPAALLRAFQYEESGIWFKYSDDPVPFNTYGWWTTSVPDPCKSLAYDESTGYVPADSYYANRFCMVTPGANPGQMGLFSINQQEQDTTRKYSILIVPGNFDRRVIFDNTLIFAIAEMNRVGNQAPACGEVWPDDIVRLAAQKHLGGITCIVQQNGRNYCDEVLSLYKQYR